jgi:sulfur relay (sulfurtransferase) complex TusBCD TusD component (DsrE family)
MLPKVTAPPYGNENGRRAYKTADRAEKTAISARILVWNMVLDFIFMLSDLD